MIKFKNQNQKILAIAISSILTLSLVGVFIGTSTTKAQSTPQEIIEQVKLAYNVNNTYTLTPQDKIDNGCKYITSSLIPKSNISKIYKIADFNIEMKNHLEFLLNQQVKVNTIIAETQTYIDASGPNILSSEMTKYLDLMYDKFAQVSYPTQLAIDGLKVNLDKEGEIGRNIADGGLQWYIDNQNYSLQFMINYFNTQREQIANNSLKADYLKSEFQTRLDMLNINFKDQMKNMIERTEYSINELNTGYGSVVKIAMEDNECLFTLNDYAEVETELRVPMINQFVCEKLFKSEFTMVNYNNGKCMLFK